VFIIIDKLSRRKPVHYIVSEISHMEGLNLHVTS